MKQINGQLDFFQFLETIEPVSFFPECKNCWCSDCKHNSKGQMIPRDICGSFMPCPACEQCKSKNQAEICQVGSWENGCATRAEEEGLLKFER